MSRAYGWRASCLAGGVTAVGVGSGAWFASDFWADGIIWGWVGFFFRKLRSVAYRCRFPATSFLCKSFELTFNFVLLKISFPGFAILSDVALRNMLYLANAIDEPRHCAARRVRQQPA